MSAAHAYTHRVPDTARQICVRVRLFAAYREAVGARELEIPLHAASTLADLTELLAARIPSLRTTRGLVALNQTYVTTDVELHDGDEVAFIPPVSGG
jgi:molybdopterin synthase sulfur carrier subunit